MEDFSETCQGTVNNVEKYTLSCLALHNYLRLTENAYYSPSGFIDSEDKNGNIIPGEWRQQRPTGEQHGGLRELRPVRGSRSRNDAVLTRDQLKEYVNSEEGSVPWQLRYVRRTSHCPVQM